MKQITHQLHAKKKTRKNIRVLKIQIQRRTKAKNQICLKQIQQRSR